MKRFLLFSSFLVLFIGLSAQSDCLTVIPYVLNVSCEGANDGAIRLGNNLEELPYHFLWSTGDTTSLIDGLVPGDYTVTVTDTLGCMIAVGEEIPGEPTLLVDNDITVLTKEITWFGADEVLASGEDVEVCVVMEHSWMRDLEIQLISPDGTGVLLHNNIGQVGNEVLVGEPVDGDDEAPVPGVGYKYCWTMDASLTWLESVPLENKPFTLTSKDYAPVDSFDVLVGHPLNGIWALQFSDLWAGDNGFVFDWYISIDGKTGRLTVADGADCISCEAEYYCMDWLRDTITNNQGQFDRFEIANWGDRTVFLMQRDNADDGGFTVFFDCAGNQFQYFQEYFPTYFPNPPFVSTELLENRTTIWDPENGVVLPDCGAALGIGQVNMAAVSCYGFSDGNACVDVAGGLPPYTYTWLSDELVIGAERCISNLSAGMYLVQVSDINGTELPPTTVEITEPDVLEIEVELASDTTGLICEPLINVSGGHPPYFIDWSYDESTNRIVATVEDANLCASNASVECILDAVSAFELENKFTLFPNPTSGVFTISSRMNTDQPMDVIIRNIAGKVMLSRQVNSSMQETSIDLRTAPRGLYLVEVRMEGGHFMKKLVVE